MALEQPDPGILRKAQRGDQAAFATIVRAYERPLFNYVVRVVGDRSLAEDITQEVLLRLYQGLPGFSHKSKFTTWMFQVTRNKVLDELRALERRPRTGTDIDRIAPIEAHDTPIERTETIDALWRAIGGLPLDLRAVLLLRDVVGLSYIEIADVEHTTLSTVKWRLYTARERVQASLAHTGNAVATSTPGATKTITA